MSNVEETKKLRDLIHDVEVAMLTTTERDGSLRSRPLQTLEVENDDELLFFTSKKSGKVDEIERDAQVNVAYAHPGNNTYVSVTGTASIEKDRAKVKELWSPIHKAWFEGPDDPNLIILRVRLVRAEYWDAPSGWIAQAIALTRKMVGEKNPNLDEFHGRVESTSH